MTEPTIPVHVTKHFAEERQTLTARAEADKAMLENYRAALRMMLERAEKAERELAQAVELLHRYCGVDDVRSFLRRQETPAPKVEVIEHGADGRPTVIAYAESDEERDARIAAWHVQQERAKDVAASFSLPPPSNVPQVELPVGFVPKWLNIWRLLRRYRRP